MKTVKPFAIIGRPANWAGKSSGTPMPDMWIVIARSGTQANADKSASKWAKHHKEVSVVKGHDTLGPWDVIR